MKYAFLLSNLVAAVVVATSCAAEPEVRPASAAAPTTGDTQMSDQLETATFGAGCFWCTEAFFQEMKGVQSVVSGYTGGKIENPSYKQVCSGDTGHAEVVRVTYDPTRVSYQALVNRFFETHDPTTLNRQGADVGTQYRSAIFYHTPEQKRVAEATRDRLVSENAFGKPIVTEIVDAREFYEAETYHQDYFRKNPNAPYSMYIREKMKKLK